jgi:hypothetical protein
MLIAYTQHTQPPQPPPFSVQSALKETNNNFDKLPFVIELCIT